MSGQQESNIATSFYNIHNIITRGLRVSVENIQAAQEHGFPDPSRREGLFNYIRAFSSVLNSHHLTEDEIAFPYFKPRLPEVDFDVFIHYHQLMQGLLDEIHSAVEKCAKLDQPGNELKSLERPLLQLNEEWPVHIQHETDDFITKVDALIPVEEQLMLIRRFSEHGQKNALPPELTVPFVLYNLPPEDRLEFSRDMPAEV